MQKNIESEGTGYLKDETLLKDPCSLTEKFLLLSKRIDELIDSCFDGDSKFRKGRDQSIQNYMDKDQHTATYLATYTERLMLKGIQNLSTPEVDEKLSAIISLFCCLSGRDVYMNQYQ